MKIVEIESNDRLRIQFTYDPQTVNNVRRLDGRKWHPDRKIWTCDAAEYNLGLLRSWGFTIDTSVTALFDRKKTIRLSKSAEHIPGLKKSLYPFQKEGVGFLSTRNGRALIADDMGLGKTVQALAWLQQNKDRLPALIVCPASLKNSWEIACQEWTDLKPIILSGTKPWLPEGQLLIINYDILAAWLPTLQKISLDTVILDEVHYAKNRKAGRTKAVISLCAKKNNIIGLSGTPIVNRPIEFHTILKILCPALFGKFWDYAQRYCGAKHNGFGWDFSGTSNADELHRRLTETIMLRRTKEEVLPDLPPKTRTVIPIELNGNRALYEDALRSVFGDLASAETTDAMTSISHISKLRQAAVTAKMDMIYDWIDPCLSSGKKLILFTLHHATSDMLWAKYAEKALLLDGRTPAEGRMAIVKTFQSDPNIQLLITSIKVGGVGWTMTAAQDVIFVEMPWSPGDLVQAEDRARRIGQTGAVNCWYLIAKDTIEEDICELVAGKEQVLDAVLDGKSMNESSILTELIRRLLKKKEK